MSGARQSVPADGLRSRASKTSSDDVCVLDVSDDADDIDDVAVVNLAASNVEAHKENRNNNIIHDLTLPLRNNSKDVCEISDEDDDNETVIPLQGFDPTVTFSDSDSDDLYSINHNGESVIIFYCK